MSYKRKHIYIDPKDWRRVQIAARRASVMESRPVSASEILRDGGLKEADRISRRFEKEAADA